MAEKESEAQKIISGFTLIDTEKDEKNKYKFLGGNSYISEKDNDEYHIYIPKDASSCKLIDIDQYYNMYNVVSPRVEVEFRIGPGSWINVNNQMINGKPAFVATIKEEKTKKEITKTVFKNEEDGNYYEEGEKTTIEIDKDYKNLGKVISITPIIPTKNNNFFVSATIEDTGYRALQLELYDRTFTTIQTLLYSAIANASKTIQNTEKTASSSQTFNLEFLKDNDHVNNNIRIRYGYNDNLDARATKNYWSAIGFSTEEGYYSTDDKKYRWVSRKMNHNSEDINESYGEEGSKNNINLQNNAPDNVLMNFNNQTTIMGGYEEFYITNVQTTLTNSGMKYTITAVGNDAMKLNGYKFVQKYANIVDKPDNILASLMHAFNYKGDKEPTTKKETLIKLLYCDETKLIPEKKIIKNESGEYKALDKDDQTKKLNEIKKEVGDLGDKIALGEKLLGCFTNKEDSEQPYIAGNTTEHQQVYKKYDANKDVWCTDKCKETVKINNKELIAMIEAQRVGDCTAKKEIIINYWIKNYAKSRLYLDSLEDGYYSIAAVNRAISALVIANNAYDFEGTDVINSINNKFKAKSAQYERIDALVEIFNVLKRYFEKNYKHTNKINDVGYYCIANSSTEYSYKDTSRYETSGYIIKFPKSFFKSLEDTQARKLAYQYFASHDGGINLYDEKNPENYKQYEIAPTVEDTNSWAPKFKKIEGTSNGLKGNRDSWFYKVITNILTISEENIRKQIEKVEQLRESLEAENANLLTPLNAIIAICYALGISNYENKNSSILSGNSGQYTYLYNCNATYLNFLENYKKENNDYDVYLLNKNILDPNNPKPNPANPTPVLKYKVKETLTKAVDDITSNQDCDNFMTELDKACKKFKAAYEEEKKAREDKSDDSNLSLETNPKEQLRKIIANLNDSDAKPKDIDEDFKSVEKLKIIIGAAGNNNEAAKAIEDGTFNNTCNTITQQIKTLTEDKQKKQKELSDLSANVISDEITLSLGGPSAINSEGKKYYKSISSLLTEFCNACPSAHDYEKEIKKLEEYEKRKNNSESTEEIKTYKDEYGNEQSIDISGNVPTYKLTWDIIGHYGEGEDKIPVVGIYYRRPRIPAKLRRYCWGSGNPEAHAIKALSITTESEFAMLSSAANSSLSLVGGKKVALKGTEKTAFADGNASDAEVRAVYDNFYPDQYGKPAFFKTVVEGDDQYKITDAMFQAINKGTITVLGDPSLRFGGGVSPMTFPIYLDISLQNEGVTWTNNNQGQKSTLSGVYVVSKITHNLNSSGYTTTMEIMRYPGINETVMKTKS